MSVVAAEPLTLPWRMHPGDVSVYVRVLDGVAQPVPVMTQAPDGSWRRTDEQAVDEVGRPLWEYTVLVASPRFGRVEWDQASMRVASESPVALPPFTPLTAQDVRVERRRNRSGVERVTVYVSQLGEAKPAPVQQQRSGGER